MAEDPDRGGAGVWAGLAWHGTGHVPFVLSGVAVAVLAGALLAGGRWIDGDAGPARVRILDPLRRDPPVP